MHWSQSIKITRQASRGLSSRLYLLLTHVFVDSQTTFARGPINVIPDFNPFVKLFDSLLRTCTWTIRTAFHWPDISLQHIFGVTIASLPSSHTMRWPKEKGLNFVFMAVERQAQSPLLPCGVNCVICAYQRYDAVDRPKARAHMPHSVLTTAYATHP